MSTCQIAFVYGDQSERIATFAFDRKDTENVAQPFAVLQRASWKVLDLGEQIDAAKIYFVYEDDDGDVITVDSDAGMQEAFAVHKDAGQDDMLLLNVKVRSNEADSEDLKEEKVSPAVNSFLDENFVLEVCDFLNDPIVRQVIPEVAASVAAAVLNRASSKELFDIAASNPILAEKNLLKTKWPFGDSWTAAYDEWIATLTQDQLGKVAFQIPIVLARLVAKREKLHKSLFVKHKSVGKLLKIKQFDFGNVDFCALMERASNAPTEKSMGHVGSVCSVCSASPIEGARYRCMVCVGFDMCEACESKASHPVEHAMMKFRSSVAGYVGLSHASALYGKKAVKYQLKAMKHEAKLAKKMVKHEKRHKHEHGSVRPSPPSYAGPMSFADAVAGSAASGASGAGRTFKGSGFTPKY